jgi:hypothetical protein
MATATERRQTAGISAGKGDAYNVKNLTATIELAASASGTLINVGYIPTNARILGSSRLYWDDLATSGSPTLDLGLIAVNGNITSDDDCLNDGLALSAVSTANVGAQVVKDFANAGLPAWDFVNGQTSDPGGVFLVRAVVRDAATTATGTVTFDLNYTLD